MATGSSIRYTVEHRRKHGVSEEAFMTWFNNTFLPRAIAIMKKHKILRFEVQKPDVKVGVGMDQVWPGLQINDCDLILEYWADDLESMEKLASDPEWTQTALQDQNKWLDTSRSNIRVGYDAAYVERGPVMNVAVRYGKGRVSSSFDDFY